MKKILSVKQAIKIARKLKDHNKTVVVAGGFFDILHAGHIEFLENSRKQGDYLFVLLEDDKKAREKGVNRPVNSQKNRAKVLLSLQSVDCVVLLRNMTNDTLYDKIIIQVAPTIIATTYGDPYVEHKKRQARLVKGRVVYVIRRIKNHSTTKLMRMINI